MRNPPAYIPTFPTLAGKDMIDKELVVTGCDVCCQADGGFHAVGAGFVAADDVERGAVIRRGADER